MQKSVLIIPLSIFIHLVIINSCLYFFTPETYLDFNSILYYNFSWLLITYSLDFYPTARKERFMTNFMKMLQLYIIFGLAYFALFAFKNHQVYSDQYRVNVYLIICLLLLLYRWLFFWLRRKYRLEGGNFVNVVVIGRDKNLKKIRKVFDEPDLGYRYMGYFDNEASNSSTYLGEIKNSFQYVIDSQVNEIYCMVSKLTQEELKTLITFADNNLKKLKIIPDNKEIFSRAMSIELYDTIPVLNMRGSPMDGEYARIVKRAFDIVFSSLVILFLLSWITPILYVLIKLESPGPLYFKQKRNGVNCKIFWCHKFRSMTVSSDANTSMATRNDVRVTRIGRILRKTSLDELPQFIDVFLGHMSVVGPRPHMQQHTTEYGTTVDKYLVRHFVKPGITGLAQIKGYRGEILRKADIINRVRLDIFYLEKWSLLLDLMIIYQTVVNALKGEEKAY
ncbi:exopolysaccharide biosynthesis polyprenyl glycosylphosphotransferase [Salegentibacter sp. F188]|uniref:Exopolysaccharide biosynthesis polyprenyl glycosylphosphotransferase n=1 Tax=Autumnicola patrickiae TaxID=3075591 RepID=A0ABU3DYU0_9FLAO|nr:exopolysaccharide biosynthesis polyprenyl glycosylphosphotransferase [Salegentibacter sp. F188]MDT0688840.1 exopolysaccharide biosynthesis polyprenyl glycosylphosphotransferase [Salegentibacter sp. F188]